MLKSVAAIAILTLAVVYVSAHGHAHDHGHAHEHEADPAFKWSRQANEDPILEEDEIEITQHAKVKPNKGHSHGGHGHSHGGHGHSHGGHGHSHGGHGHSHGHVEEENLTPEQAKAKRERLHRNWDDDDDEEFESIVSKVWLQALGSTLAISLAPFFILFFLNLDNSEEKAGQLKVLLGFASGGLLGDAFLHLIPHAIMAQEGGHGHGHSHSHGHSHGGGDGEEGHSHDMTVGLGVLAGVFAFLVVEKLVRIFNEGHSHSHGPPPPAPAKAQPKKDEKKAKQSDEDEEDEKKKDKKEKSTKKAEKAVEPAKEEQQVKVAGYLNLFADFFHNFTDGLAIGASFIAGQSVGLVTTFTILFHEIPHEIGDYAILIQSGVPPFKAKCLQLLTALGAFAGCLCSLFAQGIDESISAFILPFTAGGFIYIATVTVIPELLESSTMKQSVMEILALIAGVVMMVIIAQYE